MNTIAKTVDVGIYDNNTDAILENSALDASARSGKSSAAFRTISEVADELDVQQHVLRFWETKFSQIKPLKRGGGRRYYRPEDVQLLRSIHRLLYTEGYTIKGVQKLLRDVGKKQIIEGFAEPTSFVRGPLTQEHNRPVTPQQQITQAAPAVQASTPAKTGMSEEQRAALIAVLDELKELRGMIKPRPQRG